ncbi:MAG: serine/threonine protein kinase, partial [Planctomycetales bacterium]|nr:serine/threonine protein kinase [Planctomycetales bacterium]
MQRSTTCIPDVELRSFIADELPEQRFVEVETHLSNCEACRASLEATVGDQDWWNDLEEALGSTESEACDNENALESSVDQRTLLLELLGPTDDPAMLGRIGGYEIVALLGQGGMGAVFKAFDRSLNRFVAIKLLLPYLASSGAARKRFSREAQAAAAVVDDHVMAIHGVSE